MIRWYWPDKWTPTNRYINMLFQERFMTGWLTYVLTHTNIEDTFK